MELKKVVADLPRFEKELAQIEAQFKEALTLLPNTREIPSLLTNISNLARDCGLEIMLFQPKPEVTGKLLCANTRRNENYRQIP